MYLIGSRILYIVDDDDDIVSTTIRPNQSKSSRYKFTIRIPYIYDSKGLF